MTETTDARLRARRSFLGSAGSAAGGLLLGSAARAGAQEPDPGAGLVALAPATSDRNVMVQAPGVVPLTIQGGDGKAGLARFFGGDRGNGTRYLTQIGAPTTGGLRSSPTRGSPSTGARTSRSASAP